MKVNFQSQLPLLSITIGMDEGDICEREEDDSEEDMNARRLLRGVASRRNSRRFRPVCHVIHAKNSVNYSNYFR